MGTVPRREAAGSDLPAAACGKTWFTPSKPVTRRRVILACLLAAGRLIMPNAAPAATAAESTELSEKQALSEEIQQVPTDARVVQQLQQLEQHVRGGRISEIRDLLRLLSLSEATLLMPWAQTDPELHHIWEPLYHVKFRTVHGLAPDQLSELRREQNALASAALSRAMTGGRLETLVGVIHDFPGCDASYRAHLLLARAHLDRGNSLAAMSWLQPLLLPGVPQNWKSSGQVALQRLQQGGSGAPAAAAKVPGIADSLAIDSDTNSVSFSLPAELHWQHAPPLSPLLRDSVDRLVTSARRTGVIPWTSWAPVTDETRIFSRTVRGIAALDRRTGHPVWNWTSLADADVALQQLAERGLEDAAAFPGSEPEAVFASLDRSAVCNLLNRNAVTGRLTSDAERLFLVEDRGVGVGVSAGSRLLRGHDVAGNVPSELIALDKATGRRVWTAGGDPVEAVFENDLTAAWIAGPPTVSGAKLLIVMEQQDVILLACLSAETGRLLWKIPLVYPVTPAGQDPARRITAAVPVVSGGLIWTTTTTGWMVAVDSLTHSVAWAHRTRRQAEPADDSRAGRGRVLGARPHTSLRESWPGHSPVAAGTQLIVFPNDARDLLVLDAVRGVLKHRVPVPAHRLVLFADAQRVVLAGTESIQAWSTADASLLWTTARQSPDCLPTGTAIIRHGRLIVPMSDGTLHSLDHATGQVEEIRSLPRSAPAWGGLSAAGDDVLSFSPREILMYSNAASEVSPATLSEQAETLLRQDDAAGARKLLEAADVKVGEESSIRRLRFRVLSLLAEADGQVSVTPDELESLAVSGPEHARVLQHRIRSLIRIGRRDEAADLALNTLKESNSVQRHQVAADSGVQPLRTWLLTRLDAWLDDSDEPFRRRARELVRQQPTEILLGLQHPDAGAELLSRLENVEQPADPDEQSIHMVLQAVETMSAMDSDVDTDTASSGADETSQPRDSAVADPLKRAAQVLTHWMDRLNEDPVREPGSVEPHPRGSASAGTALRLQLVRAVVRELPQGRTASAAETRPVAEESAPPTDIVAGDIVAGDTAFPGQAAWRGSAQLAERWSRWSDGPYTPVPVSQFVSFRQSEKMLIPLTEADPFLNDSDWQWLRTPMLLKAVSGGGSGTDAWSVSCTVNDLTPYSVTANGIDRLGSVVLIRTSHAISGISVLDQRTLWHRRFPPAWSEPRNSPNSRPRTSARDSLLSTPAADLVNAAAYRVCGASPRWLCLQSRSGLEVLDLLTGEPRWSLPINGEQSQAFATGRVVVMMDTETRSVRTVRTSDGTAVASAVTPEMFEQTLLATAHELVLLRAPASDSDSHLLEWVEPVSGNVIRRLFLQNVRSLQFLDPTTLAAIAADDFQIVRLVSGESLTYPLWNSAVSGTPLPPGEQTASLPADGPRESIPKKSPLPSRPVLPPGNVLPPRKVLPPEPGDPEAAPADAADIRLMVFADPVNFYVFPRILSSRTFDLRFLGRELIPVDGPIRAIDRLTGQLRWVASSDAPIIATFDQPLAPILLLIQLEPPGPPGVPGAVPLPRVSFRGILKTTGSTLFEHRLSSRYPLPFVRLLADPEAGIDIEAFGSRVRFVEDRPR